MTDPQPVELQGVVRDCWHNVETADASLVSDCDRTVLADRGRLQQLFENLIRNAREYGGGSGTVRGRSSAAEFKR